MLINQGTEKPHKYQTWGTSSTVLTKFSPTKKPLANADSPEEDLLTLVVGLLFESSKPRERTLRPTICVKAGGVRGLVAEAAGRGDIDTEQTVVAQRYLRQLMRRSLAIGAGHS